VSKFSTEDMLLQPKGKIKTPATALLELRKEMLKEGSNTPGSEALESLLKAFSNSVSALSTLKYGFSEEKQVFFCVVEILSNFCLSVTLDKRVYKKNFQKYKDEYGVVGSKMRYGHLGMGALAWNP